MKIWKTYAHEDFRLNCTSCILYYTLNYPVTYVNYTILVLEDHHSKFTSRKLEKYA